MNFRSSVWHDVVFVLKSWQLIGHLQLLFIDLYVFESNENAPKKLLCIKLYKKVLSIKKNVDLDQNTYNSVIFKLRQIINE